MTDITIVGTGNMANGIAVRAVEAGRSVEILSRDPAKAQALADQLGSGVTVAGYDTTPSGSIVVLALPYEASREVAQLLAGVLDGRTVVDISNPVDFSTFDSLVTPLGSSAAEELAALLPGARVVKAFNTTFAATLVEGSVRDIPLDVFLASDDQEAKDAVASFVRDAGLRPVDVGPLRRARELEGIQLLVMAMQANPAHQEFNWDTALKIL